ncbi:MAG TPA: hypothetical protein VFK69_02600 [Candidatus Eisenbacteria bacterium]|nr:hypothetical protein [Candidatus Eisenbacteria bacterium]
MLPSTRTLVFASAPPVLARGWDAAAAPASGAAIAPRKIETCNTNRQMDDMANLPRALDDMPPVRLLPNWQADPSRDDP